MSSLDISREPDGTVVFPKDLMEVVEHVSTLVAGDPVVQAFINEHQTEERDAFSWMTMILGLAIAQLS